MAAKLYQILRRDKRGEPWRFVAHGARYTLAEAIQTEEQIKGNGGLVKRLPL